MRHRSPSANAMLLALATVLWVGPSQVAAQDASPVPSPSPFCAILTTAEVSAVLQLDVTIGQGLERYCSYDADNGYTAITVRHETGTLADFLDLFPDTQDTLVAGLPAAITFQGTVLYVGTDQGVLGLQALAVPGTAADATAALMALGPIAVGRLPSILTAGATPQPTAVLLPSFTADAELVSRFPSTIGGEPVQVDSLTGRQLADLGADPATLQAISDGLALLGRTLDDMSLGFASVSGGGDVSAFRVRGVDMASVQQQLMPLTFTGIADPVQAPTTIAGKSVIGVTDGPASGDEEPTYYYAHDDVLWGVKAGEPELTEIFQKLP